MTSQTANVTALRSDFELTRRARGETRTAERLIAHYELERRLAKQLLDASPASRGSTYNKVYSQLFRSLPDHPQRVKRSVVSNKIQREQQLRELEPLLRRGKSFLEIGCGDALLSMLAAKYIERVWAVDVTSDLIDFGSLPGNVSFLQTDGVSLNLQSSSIDVAYSNQLLEHLHPDDALAQLKEVYRVLSPGGLYRITTPNRWTGPHDVSVYVDWHASGFHLKEYDCGSISKALSDAGFTRVRFRVAVRGVEFGLPSSILRGIEVALATMPRALRASASRWRPVQVITGLIVHATK